MLENVTRISNQTLLIDNEDIQSDPNFTLDFIFTNVTFYTYNHELDDKIYSITFTIIDFTQDSNVFRYDCSIAYNDITEDSFIKILDIKINTNWLCQLLLKNKQLNNTLESGIVRNLNDLVKKYIND